MTLRDDVRDPAIRWTVVVAAMLAGAILIGLIATGAFRQSNGAPVAAPIPVTPGTYGSAFDVSFANAADGWALLGEPAPGPAGYYQYYVEATHDGGATWLTPEPLGRPYPIDYVPPRHIHFVDRVDGFVYGGSRAFATHDGGRTWVDTGLPFEVLSITGERGVTWGVSAAGFCGEGTTPAQCHYSAHVSADGGKTWLATAQLPVEPLAATSFGITGLLVQRVLSSDLAITTDSGTSWTVVAGPCPARTIFNGAGTADGREIWEVCSPAPQHGELLQPGTTGSVFISENGGKTWQQRTATPIGYYIEIVLSPAAGTALVVTDDNQPQISHDAGSTWTNWVTDPTHPRMQSASFSADGSFVVAVSSTSIVWISHDGGNTWHRTVGQP